VTVEHLASSQGLAPPEHGGRTLRLEPSPRRVRGTFAGETVVDSSRAFLLHERGHLPVYYFPREDMRFDLLERTEHTSHCPRKGDASYWTVRVGERAAEDAAWAYEEPIEGCPDIRGLIAFYWRKLDAWFEEDEEVFVHARDPYKRVDVLRSSRHVEVVIAGERVADSRRPSLLFETGLPTRYYLPRADVRMDLLEPTGTVTQCPYKGQARYWSFRAGGRVEADVAWTYPFPIPECPKIEQLVCFFNERVTLLVDGEEQERPRTQWSAR
jgi:uncharacterized protein (DUF427 family)